MRHHDDVGGPFEDDGFDDPVFLDEVPCWQEGLGVHCPQGQADGFPCFEVGSDCACCDRAVTVDVTRARPHRPQVMESLAPDLR